MNEIYTPSGKSSPASYIFLLLMAGLVAPTVAILYTLGVWFVPIIYLNVLLTAGLGFVIGMGMSYVVVRFGKIRSPRTATIFSVITACIAMYFAWATWIDLVVNITDTVGTSRMGIAKSSIDVGEILRIASHPGNMVDMIIDINQYGTWGMFGFTFSGILLYLVWIIEFGIVLFFSITIGRAAAYRPFCEGGNTWFKEKELPPFNVITSMDLLMQYINSHPNEEDETLTLEPRSEAIAHSVFTLYSSDFSNQNYLTVTNKVPELKDNGGVKFNDNILVDNMSISESMATRLGLVKKKSIKKEQEDRQDLSGQENAADEKPEL